MKTVSMIGETTHLSIALLSAFNQVIQQASNSYPVDGETPVNVEEQEEIIQFLANYTELRPQLWAYVSGTMSSEELLSAVESPDSFKKFPRVITAIDEGSFFRQQSEALILAVSVEITELNSVPGYIAPTPVVSGILSRFRDLNTGELSTEEQTNQIVIEMVAKLVKTQMPYNRQVVENTEGQLSVIFSDEVVLDQATKVEWATKIAGTLVSVVVGRHLNRVESKFNAIVLAAFEAKVLSGTKPSEEFSNAVIKLFKHVTAQTQKRHESMIRLEKFTRVISSGKAPELFPENFFRELSQHLKDLPGLVTTDVHNIMYKTLAEVKANA